MSSDRGTLLNEARRGDEHSRGALFETYRAYLELLARIELGRRLQSKVDAADVVQETFIEAHRHFVNFRGHEEAEFTAWLKGILAARIGNTLRHFLGTRGRDVRRERGIEVDFDQSSRAFDRCLIALQSTPSQHLVRRELGELLAEALLKLPDEYREVIVLRHFDELPFSEVAGRMQRTTDGVQKLWIRGLARLRQLMKEAP